MPNQIHEPFAYLGVHNVKEAIAYYEKVFGARDRPPLEHSSPWKNYVAEYLPNTRFHRLNNLSAGINRHVVGDARALQERSSEPS
jgi:hypothetical protein